MEVHKPIDQYPMLKRIDKVLGEIIPEGARVTVEGAPIYLDTPWGADHEFSYNALLPRVMNGVSSRASEVRHIVLLDDYSIQDTPYTWEDYLPRMSILPHSIAYESVCVDEAQAHVQQLKQDKMTLSLQDGLHLSTRGRTGGIIKTKSGKMGCVLLDAVFQHTKGPGYHIILHPTTFRSQQTDMQFVFFTLPHIPEPFHFINIFTKGENLSQIVHTQKFGGSKIL